MAKTKLVKQKGEVPKNLLFIQADAMQLPFNDNSFTTILCQNLLHCLSNTDILLRQIKSILVDNGKMYFTTLVKANRFADKYLEALAEKGKLRVRDIGNHQTAFEHVGLSMVYETIGNMLVINGNNE
jgi:ubiquinone/menaquinone biosynthesis C-methylase UbiE